MLYTPGDTRMATVFLMLHRILILYPVLTDLVGRPEYDAASQKALKQWSDSQPADRKLTPGNGKFLDRVKISIQADTFKERIESFINSTKSAMYLLRLVDGQTPVIGKFYYCCALVDKHLRVLKEAGNTPGIDAMRAIFMNSESDGRDGIVQFIRLITRLTLVTKSTSYRGRRGRTACRQVSLSHCRLYLLRVEC